MFQQVTRCFMCHKSLEPVNYLFLLCPAAKDLWNMFISLIGINWTLPEDVKEAVESWRLNEVDNSIKKTWQMTPRCIFWCILEGKECQIWSNLSPVNDIIHLLDFISSLTMV
ncbi:hypothetical protein H5410_064326 [Solanum commersonii]|uniref:Reverse transcriptase zinc-binding domain-containing protein n=1 Tax=Solanum commersonii TaxID=4109 RepID=A0A9J5VZN6_SOLCO|nr:hypothetical protein H5410_064326 [Solanum commersonii]